ncbi:nitrate- and nitrite sensing domain-containing protein [Nocardiopsis algeriensis]|uniref:sensor histidine kinase n=1 Tax=Nocardiopsis algeriensis TaxID=1478215 RepID=UPI003B4308FD
MFTTHIKASTIRGQLTRIVLVPSLCFLVLWLVVASVGTVRAAQLMGAVVQAREGSQALAEAVGELHTERRLSLVYLGRFQDSGPDEDTGRDLDEQRERTDAALADAEALAEDLGDSGDEEVRRSAAAFLGASRTVEEIRLRLDEHTASQEEVLLTYGEVLTGADAVTTALVHATDGGESVTDAVLTTELLGARAEYATADALLAGVIAAGEMDHGATAHFTHLTASYRSALTSAREAMHPGVRDRYEKMTGSRDWAGTEELSRRVVTRSPVVERGGEPTWNSSVDVDAEEWDASSSSALALMDDLVSAQVEHTVDLAWNTALVRVSFGVAAAAATLLAGILAISAVSRSSRRLTGRLARLRGQILDRDEDLPGIIDRAQRGGKVDVQEELPPLDESGNDEIGQVAEAFDTAQLTAVAAAVRQAEIRRGANKAFLGIAFRNQTLVQRQLRLLDELEYNEQDPEALRRLFRLDHLTTRARRYADNLIILGGGQSTRRWNQPRPLVDVLRAAIAETEDYERVRLTSVPRLLMHGQVVSDIVHLLAELVENATQFSPAGTPVDVSCTPAPEGLLVEVEDRGLGMSEQGYAQAQRTLSRPPEFDVMALPEDPRLGLFVVARLAERHGVRVWLRPSPYGGTRATTLVPASLLEPVENPARHPAPPQLPAVRHPQQEGRGDVSAAPRGGTPRPDGHGGAQPSAPEFRPPRVPADTQPGVNGAYKTSAPVPPGPARSAPVPAGSFDPRVAGEPPGHDAVPRTGAPEFPAGPVPTWGASGRPPHGAQDTGPLPDPGPYGPAGTAAASVTQPFTADRQYLPPGPHAGPALPEGHPSGPQDPSRTGSRGGGHGTPLPKRPVPRERSGDQVPAPTRQGGHGEQ